MSSKHNPEKHDPWHDEMPHQGLDPLLAARQGSRSLSDLWLKHGEEQTPIQRTGFILISLMSIVGAIFLGNAAWECFLDDSRFFSLIFALASVSFVFFGVRGFRNAIRRKRKTLEEHSQPPEEK